MVAKFDDGPLRSLKGRKKSPSTAFFLPTPGKPALSFRIGTALLRSMVARIRTNGHSASDRLPSPGFPNATHSATHAMHRAIYPGSFDPPHNGHIDVIERASRLCDEVLVAVARNSEKKALFSTEERVAMIRESTAHLSGVTVTCFEGLMVNFAVEKGANAVVRGLRAVSDFEYEFQMALANRQLQPDLETIFLMPSQENIYLSSRIVKEIAKLHGDVSSLIPEATARALAERF